jgi:hypothetical protein
LSSLPLRALFRLFEPRIQSCRHRSGKMNQHLMVWLRDGYPIDNRQGLAYPLKFTTRSENKNVGSIKMIPMLPTSREVIVSGPRVWQGAYCPLRPNHFHGTRHFVYTHFPKAMRNAYWFTSPIRFAFPWEGPDYVQPAED